MINYIKATNHFGESITLELRNPEKSGFFIRGIDGLGPGKSTINMSEALGMDGSFINSIRNESKTLTLDIGFMDDGVTTIESIRQQTYRFFPRKKLITIEVGTDNRTGIIYGYVESNEPNIFSKEASTIISFSCPAAYFIGKDLITNAFSGISGGFSFPFENASTTLKLLRFSDIYKSTQRSVIYNGDVDTGFYILVEIQGNVNNLVITNVGTGETMSIISSILVAMTGLDLVSGDKILISTNRGNKYVYLIRGVSTINILNTLGTNSTWFTLERGDNVFSYSATSGVANVLFTTTHKIVYEGL